MVRKYGRLKFATVAAGIHCDVRGHLACAQLAQLASVEEAHLQSADTHGKNEARPCVPRLAVVIMVVGTRGEENAGIVSVANCR